MPQITRCFLREACTLLWVSTLRFLARVSCSLPQPPPSSAFFFHLLLSDPQAPALPFEYGGLPQVGPLYETFLTCHLDLWSRPRTGGSVPPISVFCRSLWVISVTHVLFASAFIAPRSGVKGLEEVMKEKAGVVRGEASMLTRATICLRLYKGHTRTSGVEALCGGSGGKTAQAHKAGRTAGGGKSASRL